MEFDVNVLTNAGVALIARATAANQLIYTRVLTDADEMSADTAASASTSDFTGDEGPIIGATADENYARITGAVQAQSAGTVKSFALCAKIDGDADDIVLVVLSSASGVTFSAAGQSVELGFIVAISDAETVTAQVTSTGAVAFGDIERFVSMHAAGDPTSGEAQTVLGAKTFTDAVTFSSTATLESGASVSGTVSMASGAAITFTGDNQTIALSASGNALGVSKSIVPAAAGLFLGTQNSPYSRVYTFSLYFGNSGYAMTYDDGDLTTEVGGNIVLTAGGDIFIDSDIIPGTASSRNIGSQSMPFAEVHADSFVGLMPHPEYDDDTDTLTVPVGAIVCLYGVVALAGQSVAVSGDTYVGTLSGSQGTNTVTAGTYVALSSNASSANTLLAMRIA